MSKFNNILSPLDQFEIKDLLSLDTNIVKHLHISLTNIGLYLLIGIFIIITYSLLATNNNKIIPNNWSISQETLYSTVHGIVINQINANKGQVYFARSKGDDNENDMSGSLIEASDPVILISGHENGFLGHESLRKQKWYQRLGCQRGRERYSEGGEK